MNCRSALPVAGIDLFVNGKLLADTIAQISAAHGLSPEQLAKLPAPLRSRVDDLAQELGRRLGAQVELVTFAGAGETADGAQSGAWDVAFIGAEPQRAERELHSLGCSRSHALQCSKPTQSFRMSSRPSMLDPRHSLEVRVMRK